MCDNAADCIKKIHKQPKIMLYRNVNFNLECINRLTDFNQLPLSLANALSYSITASR